jgi:hypothetical protein
MGIQQGNRYLYVNDDPVNATDPSGQLSLSVDVSVTIPFTSTSVGGGVDVADNGLGVHGSVGAGIGPGKASATVDPQGQVSNGGQVTGSGCIGAEVSACAGADSSGHSNFGLGVGDQANLSYTRTHKLLGW